MAEITRSTVIEMIRNSVKSFVNADQLRSGDIITIETCFFESNCDEEDSIHFESELLKVISVDDERLTVEDQRRIQTVIPLEPYTRFDKSIVRHIASPLIGADFFIWRHSDDLAETLMGRI